MEERKVAAEERERKDEEREREDEEREVEVTAGESVAYEDPPLYLQCPSTRTLVSKWERMGSATIARLPGEWEIETFARDPDVSGHPPYHRCPIQYPVNGHREIRLDWINAFHSRHQIQSPDGGCCLEDLCLQMVLLRQCA